MNIVHYKVLSSLVKYFLCPLPAVCDLITVALIECVLPSDHQNQGGIMMTSGKKRRRAVVDRSFCVACGCCVKVCPLQAIQVVRGIAAQVDPDKCVGCGKCARECPASIIEIQEVTT